MTVETTKAVAHKASRGSLLHWMKRVLKECNRARRKWDAEAVHDLRVALRRCRSVADGMREVDPDRAWRRMKRAGRELFRALGQLRDTQVQLDWVKKLGPAGEPVREQLLELLQSREQILRKTAAEALDQFDRREWRRLAAHLAERARRISPDGLVAQDIALGRWEEADRLLQRARRLRSRIAWHQLRIGIKRLRYTAENFLPRRYEKWAPAMKRAQDLLGEVHDLDMLRRALRPLRLKISPADRKQWEERIELERSERLNEFKRMACGKESIFIGWREDLAQGRKREAASVAHLTAWASYRDPDPRHAGNVATLALQLFDGLATAKTHEIFLEPRARRILQAAALLHDVGRTESEAGHHKISYRMIRDMTPPAGWSAEDLRWVALIARYHRGAEPRPHHEGFASLAPAQQQSLLWLAALLRFADGLDSGRDGQIAKIRVDISPEALLVTARGYVHDLFSASHIAERKHLLEAVARRPVIVRAEELRPALLPLQAVIAS